MNKVETDGAERYSRYRNDVKRKQPVTFVVAARFINAAHYANISELIQ